MKNLFFFLLLFTQSSWAIRPFVTDDARVLDYGQIGSEIWVEQAKIDSDYLFTEHALLSWNFYKWIEVTAVGNFQTHDGDILFFNPVAQGKVLLAKAGSDSQPGLAISAAHIFNAGSGEERERASSSYLLGMSTIRFKDDHLIIHTNLGFTNAATAAGKQKTRAFWGLGFDHSLHEFNWRVIGEVYSGDPYSAYRSPVAAQGGLRWLYHHQYSFDLVFGGQPVYGENYQSTAQTEYWVQMGVRISADLYTEPGVADAHGAKGIFR